MPHAPDTAPAAPSGTPTYTVAVRTLCAFTARAGDLDLRFTPAPTALEGQEGHALVAARRGAGWQAERPLSGTLGALTVRGRADGWDATRGRLEEIKTHKGRLDDQPANHRALHRAQLRVYGALLCAELGLPEVELALVYVDVASQQETVIIERASAATLQAELEERAGRFAAWAAQEAAHRSARDAALHALAFPHAGFRTGQRELAEAVYRAAVRGRCLLAQAPTGIGKTVGTLFPLLKAMPVQRIDKVFALSAKSAGKGLFLESLAQLQPPGEPGARLRVLELVARDKACEHPDKACHGDSCPLARGFYDRLAAARQAAMALPQMDRDSVRTLALAHGLCPYYLAQELARWADAVVGDYHYWFDVHALLHALTQTEGWRVGVLADEAHNLIDRARGMYSAALSQTALRGLRTVAPAALKGTLSRLQRAWGTLNQALDATDAAPGDWRVLPDLPTRWLSALQQTVADIGAWQADHPTEVEPLLQRFYLDAIGFVRLAETHGPHAMVDLGLEPGSTGARRSTTLTLRNVLPAPYLQPRFAAAHTVTLFSATLQPPAHHLRLLGLPGDTVVMEVPTPFRAEQLQVRVAAGLSTRWKDRAASLPGIVALMADTWRRHPGNHLAFFSSHDYLQQVADAFERAHPDIPVWRQARRMSEPEQAAFLQRFQPEGQGIGFAVLGGAFAEGVDLPGRRLIGAFIATLGLAQVNPVNEALRERLDALLGPGQGHDAVYLHPGIQKVVQAAGRVIRTPDDQGTVVLMDDRYGRRAVQRLLPSWWRIERA
ncbi:ATP-dependent DNA helicase [Aquabacterium olei]|uniref:ATP-dependent DNA helicase n=1 Tax=Aquabacterium olei TaxID=1296669 RepID=A0A2U8FN24_9BURK|nr:ATP-dependent DNA helicase [Aquabacterium olei]AWI52451.1 ATP-dependent DNA helicase [Aquabacterium olei]